MRALRVVGITEEGGELSVVLEDPVRRERYTVPADEHLRAAARGDLTRLGQISIELESQLRPREIQARIRAGASVEQVASAAGVPVTKIERFAYPVLLERSRTAEVAQRAHPIRAEGPDSRMLGDVVAHTFGLRGQDYTGGEWDSWKGEDGRWVVVLSWRAGRSDNAAHWTFQPGAHGGTVTALDEHASDLVEGLPQRPLRTVGPVIDMTRPEDGPTQSGRVAAAVESRRTADGTDAPPPSGALTARTETRERAPERRATPSSPVPAAPTSTAPTSTAPMPPAQRQAEPVEHMPGATRTPAAHAPAPATPSGSPWSPAPSGAPWSGTPAADFPPTGSRSSGDPSSADPAPAGSRDASPTSATPSSPTTTPATPAPTGPPSGAPATAGPPALATPEPATPAAATPAATTPAASTPAATSPAAAAPAPSAPSSDAPESGAPASEQAAQAEPVAPAEPAPRAPEPDAKAAKAAEEPAPAPARRTKKGKPVMPSWDEVLLGVRGQR